MSLSTQNKAAGLSKLFQKIVGSKGKIAQKFDNIMSMLAKELNADATACYLVVDDNYIELFASRTPPSAAPSCSRSCRQ